MGFAEDFQKIIKDYSFSPLLISSGCCFQEVLLAANADVENSDFTVASFQKSPRHADLLIVAGPITHKSSSAVLKIYKQMPDPKYVIALGNCACSGNVFAEHSYSVINGVDKIIPVDVFLPLCPPSPESIGNAVNLLKEKINSKKKR